MVMSAAEWGRGNALNSVTNWLVSLDLKGHTTYPIEEDGRTLGYRGVTSDLTL